MAKIIKRKRKIEIGKEIAEDGTVVLFFKNENWGPIISGKDEKEARERFNIALKATSIICSLTELNDDYENNRFGKDSIEKLKDRRIKMEGDNSVVVSN